MMEGQDDAIQVKHKPTDKDCELTKNLVPTDLSGLSSFAQLCLCDLQSHDKSVVENSLKANSLPDFWLRYLGYFWFISCLQLCGRGPVIASFILNFTAKGVD